MKVIPHGALALAVLGFHLSSCPARPSDTVDSSSLRGKVMCGYQGWFRCPGDAAKMGWIHWSRDSRRIAPDTLTFEMWPDMREYAREEQYAAPGFTYPDGGQATLYSADNPKTVLRHFQWMRQYGIDGAFLQHFLVDLPGGPEERRYESRVRVLQYVRAAARRTGRIWALSYDVAGMPLDRIEDVLKRDWRKLVDSGVTRDGRYLHQNGLPVVQIWGFYYRNASNHMDADLANRLIDFFRTPGKYRAFLVGGGDWDWRRNPDPEWQRFYRRLDAYAPWNIGNWYPGPAGEKRASTQTWAGDREECERRGMIWMPVVYPGFGWDNLMQKPPGSTQIPRRGGRFLWEQFVTLAKLKADTVYVAMFDEVDEGTAIYKVTSDPPTQAHFVGYEGLPSDWYLRLVGEGTRMLRGMRPISDDLPITP